jgi:hypothetical protein
MHDDDIKFPQDAKDPINESRRTYSDGFIPDQKGKAQHKPSGEKKNGAYSNPKPILAIRIWRRINEWRINPYRQRTHAADWMNVGLTLAIVFIAAIQAFIYFQQKRIMESSRHQTDQLIAAAKIQADASERQWSAMEGQLEQMKRQINVQKDTAKEQFGTPKINLLSWANPSAPLDQQQARWFGLYSVEKGKRPTAIFKIKNDGKGEAKFVAIAVKLEFLESRPESGPKGYAFRDDEYKDIGNISPFDPKRVSFGQPQPPDIVASFTESRSRPISAEEYASYKAGRTALFIWGEIRYKNFMEEDLYRPFCYWLKATDVPESGTNGEFLDCGQFKGSP